MDTLVGQTLRDIEIVMVNDCSPDNSLEILQEYASRDSRIKIVNNKQNLKLAGARNEGLAVATGEYVSIIDSDDYIDLDFCEKLYELAKREDADIAKGILRNLPSNTIINNNARIDQNKYNFRFSLTTAIFRRLFLQTHDIKFTVDTICFQIQAVYWANKIVTRDDTCYNYCRRDDSNDSPTFSLEKWQNLNIRGADHVLDFINSVSIKKSDYLLLVRNLILPLYSYGYERLSVADKKIGTIILHGALKVFWNRVKYKFNLLLPYWKKRIQLIAVNTNNHVETDDRIAIATYSNAFTTNIGDAIQENAIYDAIKTVLPDAEIIKIPRKGWRSSKFCGLSVMQGWFGEKSAIPQKQTLWIGTHFAGKLRKYMEKHPPQGEFGARDETTRIIVPGAYLSRCYTLTLPRRQSAPKNGSVFLTNIPKDWEAFIPQELLENCIRVTHHYKGSDMSAAARELIARYRDEARLVIACKVHCISPCTAMGIPVVAISENDDCTDRVGFLKGLLKINSQQDLRDGNIDWNPQAPNIEELKVLMLKNLKMSILSAQGNHIDRAELEDIRRKIEAFPNEAP